MRKKTHSATVKAVGQRVLALLLAFVLCLGLAVQAFALEEPAGSGAGGVIVGNGSYSDEFGYLELEVSPNVVRPGP